MGNVRVIRKTNGKIVVQHRPDGVYDDSTLPPSMTPADIASSTEVDESQLADVTDTHAQLDVVGGALVKDLTVLPLKQRIQDQLDAGEVMLNGIDADASVPADTKKYIQALCKVLNIGSYKLSS